MRDAPTVASPAAPVPAPSPARRWPWRRPGRRLSFALAALLVAGGVAVTVTNPFAGGSSGGVPDNGAATSLATVARRSLSSQTQVDGTLGYAGSYSVVNQRPGTTTWLPAVGHVVRRGQTLYRIDDSPVVLLYGSTPAYRELRQGESGADVRQLNAALVALGYADGSELDPASDDFGWRTRVAVEKLQHDLGVGETGKLALGTVVFLPTAIRVTTVSATLGAPAGPGVILTATSTRHEVTVKLDAAQQTDVKVGDRVTITLPNGRTTPGRVSAIGSVASTSSADSDTSTIDVQVRLRHQAAAGRLDQAPVGVLITTASVERALVVPVNALLALAGGGYAVEAVNRAGIHRLVPVSLGLFDDADGLVQVSGSGLRAGQRVVIPAS
jgi:peptidoglycan hydrolase-like protein with peptidoglycan-binding domain